MRSKKSKQAEIIKSHKAAPIAISKSPLEILRYTATGSVSVLKRVAPASIKVAPNSPIALAQAKIAPHNKGFQHIGNPQWQQLGAVKNGQVFLIPNNPFGWLDSPPSVNRLLGVRWVSHLVSGKPMTEFTKEVKTFYYVFYQIELTLEQATQLLHDVK